MAARMKNFLALLALLACVTAQAPVRAQETLAADLNESVFKLPSTVINLYGRSVSGEMTVTQYKPDGEGPFPIAVLLHGRAVGDRSLPARQRYLTAARYFVRRGFAVWVPTRLGYGSSAVPGDPENSGDCRRKNYTPGFEAAATSALDVLRYASKQSFADASRSVVLGQSYGGMTAIALAAKRPEGVSAFINFAGGSGGNPDLHPAAPCEPQLLRALYAGYGKTARAPSLWMYSENDRYFGTALPQQWFAAFQASGGAGEFRVLPAFGADGHSLFGQAFEIWRPVVDDFLRRQGYTIPSSAEAPPATDFARIAQVDKVPRLNRNARDKYQRFLKMDIPRAFALGPRGEYAFVSARDAVRRAMDACRKFAPTGCALYAVDDRVVWKDEQ
jgi:dienelactone hydrolase